MEEELKDCPFCGGKVKLVKMGPNYRVDCPECESSFETYFKEDKEDLLEYWNKREPSHTCSGDKVYEEYIKDPKNMKLKGCPFCGDNRAMLKDNVVTCRNCGSTVEYDDEVRWNNRA